MGRSEPLDYVRPRSDLISPKRVEAAKPNQTRPYLGRPATAWRRTGAGSFVSAAWLNPRPRLVKSATIDGDFKKKSNRIPVALRGFSGESYHCFWQMWYGNQPSSPDLLVCKLRFDIGFKIGKVEIWKKKLLRGAWREETKNFFLAIRRGKIGRKKS